MLWFGWDEEDIAASYHFLDASITILASSMASSMWPGFTWVKICPPNRMESKKLIKD